MNQKRLRINVISEAADELGELSRELDLTLTDLIREALSLFIWLCKETRSGNRLLIERGKNVNELFWPRLERLRK